MKVFKYRIDRQIKKFEIDFSKILEKFIEIYVDFDFKNAEKSALSAFCIVGELASAGHSE